MSDMTPQQAADWIEEHCAALIGPYVRVLIDHARGAAPERENDDATRSRAAKLAADRHEDVEFRRHVFRTLGAIQQEQRDSRREQHLQRVTLTAVTVLLVLLAIAVAVLAIVPGPQLVWL